MQGVGPSLTSDRSLCRVLGQVSHLMVTVQGVGPSLTSDGSLLDQVSHLMVTVQGVGPCFKPDGLLCRSYIWLITMHGV